MNMQQYILTTYDKDIESVSLIVSSGKSHVYVFPDITIKHFIGQDINSVSRIINNEVRILSIISLPDENYFIKIVAYNLDYNFIIYETVRQVKIDILVDDNEQFCKIIKDVAENLYVLHSRGFKHGDASVHNIGFKNGRYIFFDFEGVREIIREEEDSYNDDNDFLQNLRTLYTKKGINRLRNIVNDIIEYIDSIYTRVEYSTITTLFKKTRPQKTIIYLYEPHNLLDVLQRFPHFNV